MRNLLKKLSSSARRALAVIGSILREIFDESAYARFLERRQLTTSPAAYAEFLAESRQQRERRPRCC
jgi:hypothetical protein